ncbi:DUF5954 family protein [Micromonospora sp. NPDC050417]|uniref:DUF5954 family protein n=1 Tax=Micromonospora sp. NPDC050417 TaxID=3364280 RepID=UPI0037A29ECD
MKHALGPFLGKGEYSGRPRCAGRGDRHGERRGQSLCPATHPGRSRFPPFRRLLSEPADAVDSAAERKEYEAPIRLLPWKVVNDLTVNGRRHRIIRAQPFIRMGPDGPEPPRPTDPDPTERARNTDGPARNARRPIRGFRGFSLRS